MTKWLAASVYAMRGWWWMGMTYGLWLPFARCWRYAHAYHDWERFL